MIESDYRWAAYALLPKGDAWPEQPGEFPKIDEFINALLDSLADVDSRSTELVNESVISETVELLPNWEAQYGLPDEYSEDGASIEQRRADILAKRRKRTTPNLYVLRPVVDGLLTGSVLSHHLHPPFVSGESGAGEECGDGGAAVWSLEYMEEILTADGSELDAWDLDGGVSVTPDTHTRPKDTELVMDSVSFPALGFVSNDIDTTTVDVTGTVRFVIWAKTPDDATRMLSIQYEKRDGTFSTLSDHIVCGTWAKIVYEADIGAGATQPRVILTSDAGGAYILGDAHAGVRRPQLEGRVSRLFPINTEGEFLVHGEGPVYVYDDEGNPLFTDDGDPIVL